MKSATIFLVYVIHRMIEASERKENEAQMRAQLVLANQQYGVLKNGIENARVIKHDIKYHEYDTRIYQGRTI